MPKQFDTHVLKQPRWIAAIVIGALIALIFMRLGVWQLDRLEERRAGNATIEGRMVEPARPLVGIVGQYGDDVQEMAYRRAVVEGEFRTDAEFFSIGRTYDDLTGTLVATPFDLVDGPVLIVVRGLVPPGTPGPPAPGYQPADGRMAIEGSLLPGEQPTAIGESDPADGQLTSLSRLDLAYIDQWIEGDVLPVMLMLDAWTVPYPEATPKAIPEQELTEGSHLGYAVQWFSFALIVVVGVAVLVYKAGTEEAVSETVPDQTSPP